MIAGSDDDDDGASTSGSVGADGAAVMLKQGSSGLCLGVVPPVPARKDHCETRVTTLPCNGSDHAVRWKVQKPPLGGPATAAGDVGVGGDGDADGAPASGRSDSPTDATTTDATTTGATTADAATTAATRSTTTGAATGVVLVNALNGQPLNLYASPLDKGRDHKDVQTCSPVTAAPNNLWQMMPQSEPGVTVDLAARPLDLSAAAGAGAGAVGSIKSNAASGSCLSTGMVAVTPDGPPRPVFSSFSAIFNRKMQKLPLFSCI